MTVTRVKLENFTVFESLALEPSPGINVLVGPNGTGKTHPNADRALFGSWYSSLGNPVSSTGQALKLAGNAAGSG